MRRVIWKDRNGYMRAALIRDGDPDEMADQGIPLNPPDITRLNCEELLRDLHNELVMRGLFTWKDFQGGRGKINSVFRTVFKKRITDLYRMDGPVDS